MLVCYNLYVYSSLAMFLLEIKVKYGSKTLIVNPKIEDFELDEDFLWLCFLTFYLTACPLQAV